MIGVGGIGSGRFFALQGNRTLGREESRGGHFLPQKDYCKLHIVSHYVSMLMGANFETLAIGRVGDDEAGHRLLEEMEQAGINLRYVACSSESPTLFSFCFKYPDGSGGNMTTSDSASSRVESGDIRRAEQDFLRYKGSGIAMALPEVPLEARKTLLEMGTVHNFFRVASFTSEEIITAGESGLLKMLDLLAMNQDEASAAVGSATTGASISKIVDRAVSSLSALNPSLQMVLTAGSRGSWGWDGVRLQYIPAIPIESTNSAGAGDAYLAGTLIGLATSLSLFEAQQLGNLIAALSTTSPHTIHFGIDRNRVADFVGEADLQLGSELRRLLGIEYR